MEERTYNTEIQINGKAIPLNPFVQSFFSNTLLGSVQALRDVPSDIESITIKIIKAY